jgi:uncharacterized membrane protein YccC
VLFLVAFGLAVWQYQQIDPRRRVLNLRFGLMAGATVALFYYVFHMYDYPNDWLTSWIFCALGAFWVGWAWYLLRRMPPREDS